MKTKLRSTLAKLINYSAHRRFVQACRHPDVIQNQVWQKTRKLLAQSAYWQSRGLTSQSALSEFPISTYADYGDALFEAYEESAHSPLNGEKILFWCQSSGTTSRRKLFPLTPTYMNQIRRAATPFIYEIMQKRPSFLNGQTMFFTACSLQQQSPAGIEVGFISHYSFKTLPRFLRRFYTFPEELLADSTLFDEWAPYYALCSDVSSILAVTPGMITNLVKVIVANKTEYLALMRGEGAWPSVLPRPQVSIKRLEHLTKILDENESPIRLKKIWPQLSMITTWQSSTAGWQMKELRPHLTSDILVTDGQYSATEGWMGLPEVNSNIGSRFHPGAVVVEFLEYGLEAKAENLIKPWELQPGGLYEVFLTTTMGLIRYRLYDVIKCLGFWERSPILSFQYKADNSISLGQTRFSEINLIEAIKLINFECPTPWIIAPESSGQRMMFVSQADSPELRARVKELDRVWAQVNPEIQSDYDTQLLKPMGFCQVGSEHAIWQTHQHAQSKTRLISKTPFEKGSLF